MKVGFLFGDMKTGGAWLSSARVVRCWVKSRNERNPCQVLPACEDGNSLGTDRDNREEDGDDVKSSCPLWLGLHTYYNGLNRGKQDCEVERNLKSSPQFGLQAETRLHEVGIASNRRSAYCGEYVPGPCTHRPSHHGSLSHPKYFLSPKVGSVTGVKS